MWIREINCSHVETPEVRQLSTVNCQLFNGFLFANPIYLLIFNQKARIKYTIRGDPMVRKEI